ncbi:MAG: TolC family protein [Bacteroidales bacterium]|nr:TolC family protein [Bacteroidales bacterium]MCF8456524.1 TolC family protein [Bacteroidales bacterium]
MKKIIISILSLLTCSSFLFSQNSVENIISEIEKNNTTLSALQKSMEAEKLNNKTGIYLQNPEVEFNYLWGNPSGIGNRTDFGISQSFDFPTVYKYQNQISDIRNNQVDLEYQKQRKAIMFQVRSLCYDLIYANAMYVELSKRVDHAQSIASSYKSKFDVGESNIIEFNKAQLNLLNTTKQLESVEIERETLIAELCLLNGGEPVEFNESEFTMPLVPSDFEQWYAQAEQNNPVINWLKQEVELSNKQLKLNRAKSYPKLQAGYMSEKVVGEQFQGVTVGLSIPLWENKNSVKYARANSLAIESITTDTKLQFYNQLKALHAKAVALQKNASDYRTNLLLYNSSDLLKKALDQGEISLIDYMMELSIYYESVSNLLEMERELNKGFAELMQYM